MSRELISLFLVIICNVWALTALITIIAVFRKRASRTLGIISLVLLAIGAVTVLLTYGPRLHRGHACAVVFYAIPGVVGVLFHRKPPIPPGHCIACGYNLTGNVSGKCSECGALVPAP